MTRPSIETAWINLDDEDQTSVEVTFRFTPGTPETGRGYLANPMNYDPGSGPEYDLLSAKREDGTPVDIATIDDFEKLIEGGLWEPMPEIERDYWTEMRDGCGIR